MSKTFEPNPPARKAEDFPKTNTIPNGWVMDELTQAYNPPCRETEPTPRSRRDCPNGASATPPEELFARRLDPSSGAGDEFGMWL